MEIQRYVFLTSALDGGEWSAYWLRGCVSSRASLDAVAKRIIPNPHRESDPDRPGRPARSLVTVSAELSRLHRNHASCYLSGTASRAALGPIQPPFQWVSGFLSPGLKRPRRKADHSPPSGAEIKNAWRYTSTAQYVFMAWYLT